ncbi:MAG: hypothetical protein LC122_00575 [Chitinophagales bacterium]|nr:hypothetical protein [Chitinophagales bacterium]
MPLKAGLKYINKHQWLIPLIGILLAYLPLLSSIMSLKNDTTVLSYPIFYYFSSQIHHGIFPFWHYNMHLGFALYADPGTPFLNPLFWLFALIGNSISIYSFYIFIHLLIGVYGMYLLSKQLGFENRTSSILSIAYIAGGYFVSHLQHSNHIVECTYLPWVINYLFALFKKPCFKNAVLLGLFFYLFTISGYPGFAIGMPYFIIILGIGYFIVSPTKKTIKQNSKALLLFGLSVLIAVILCLPFLNALYHNLENFQRSSVFTGGSYLHEGGASPALGLISFILPLASVVQKTPFASSDISWNNMYFGLVPFIFLLSALKYKNIRSLLPHLLVIAFFLDMSFEGQIKQLFFKIPLLNFLRYNGGLRIYAILSFLIIAGTALNNYFSEEKPLIIKHKKIIKVLLFIISITFLSAFIIGIINHQLLLNTKDGFVKAILHIGFIPAVLLQSAYVIIMLLLIKKWIHQKHKLLLLAIADIIICFWVNLPFTGLSIKSMPSIKKDIEASTKYIQNIQGYEIITKELQQPAVNHVVYAPALMSNKVGVIPLHAYPSGKKTYFDFVEKNGFNYFNHRPVCFLFSDSLKALPYTIDAANMFIQCSTSVEDTLYIHQNFDKNWYAFSNNNPLKIEVWQNTFMKIILPSNTNNITLKYQDAISNKLLFIPFIGIITIAIYFLILYFKRKNSHT